MINSIALSIVIVYIVHTTITALAINECVST